MFFERQVRLAYRSCELAPVFEPELIPSLHIELFQHCRFPGDQAGVRVCQGVLAEIGMEAMVGNQSKEWGKVLLAQFPSKLGETQQTTFVQIFRSTVR